MTDNAFNGSDTSGSPITSSVPNPNLLGGSGQTQKETPTVDYAQHKEMESLVGRQGQELGEYRKFFNDISPLLEVLDKNPGIVQAVVDGKITEDLAKAAMEGKVSIADAQNITNQAQVEVKKELGKEALKNTSPEDINKLIEEKAREITMGLETKLKERDDLSAFEASVNEFISRTPDFANYASEIDKWLDEHDITDIAVAYYAVKGELSEREAKKQADIDRAEAEKSGALNMGGGRGNATHIRGDANYVDSLIASKSNPNIF